MTPRHLVSIFLALVGASAIVVGTCDPLLGPVLVLPGSVLVILGGCLTDRGRHLLSLLWHRRLALCGLTLPLALAVYVGTFSYWWQHSPVEHVTTSDGRHIRVVQFQFNKVSWHTQVIWLPAFAFMEHVYGYEKGGYAAMYDKSIMEYLRLEYVR